MKSLTEVGNFLEFLAQPILISNNASEILFANTACLHLFGYSKAQMLQCHIEDLTTPIKHLNHAKLTEKYICSHAPAKEMTERNLIPCVDAQGNKFASRISIASAHIGEELYGVAILQDFTSVQNRISELETQSNIDILTGLFNRRYLHEILKADSRVHTTWLATGVLYLDLNKFKPINDNLGHKMGDQILKIVANRLRETVRFDDIAFREGGDEFLILLNLTDVSNRQKVLEKICSKINKIIAEPIVTQGHSVNISASIGAGIYTDQQDDLAAFIHATDQAMYVAKKLGTSVSFVK